MKQDTKRIRKSILKLEKELQKDVVPSTILHLAEEYRKLDENDKASDILKRGLQHHNENSSIKLALAKILLLSERFEDVRELVQSVLVKNPDNLVARKILGELPEIESDTSSMETSTTESIESERPIYPDLVEKAIEYFHKRQFEQSLSLFKEYLESDPDNEIAKNGFTLAYTAWIESCESSEDLEQMADINNEEYDRLVSTQHHLQLWLNAIREVRHSRAMSQDS